MSLTDDALVRAIKQVLEEGGTKEDLFRILDLDKEKDSAKLSNKLSAMRRAGVKIPDFRKMRKPKKPGLTEDAVTSYNEALGG